MSDEKVINMNEARQKASERKLNSQKIVEKHLKTGKKLTQQEALTILTEMCDVVHNLEAIINQLAMRVQSIEFQSGSTSAANVTLHRMLQEKKKLFTEDDFKEAWAEYIEKPMNEAKEKAEKAQEELANKMKEKAKKESLDAAEGRETKDKPSAATEQEQPVQSATGDMPEGK